MTVLSLVVPIFNEGATIDQLAERCLAACATIPGAVEILLVDDHSTDGSDKRLAMLPHPIHHLRLPENRGQWGATRYGLTHAQGQFVAVMDGDLQDPPELLPTLFQALTDNTQQDVIFATKSRRIDPLWFRVGRRGYQTLQGWVNAGNQVPSGAGSYCVMRAAVAQRAAAVDIPHANLAAVLTALRVPRGTVPFARSARVDGASRVGPIGLTKEALGSLWLMSPLGRRRLLHER